MKKSKSQEPELENNDIGKISIPLLQRKFQLSHDTSKQICDFIDIAKLDSGWFDVKEKPVTEYGIELLVYAKPLNSADEIFGYFIASLNPCSGWVKKDDHTCLLYVTHYQFLNLPKVEYVR